MEEDFNIIRTLLTSISFGLNVTKYVTDKVITAACFGPWWSLLLSLNGDETDADNLEAARRSLATFCSVLSLDTRFVDLKVVGEPLNFIDLNPNDEDEIDLKKLSALPDLTIADESASEKAKRIDKFFERQRETKFRHQKAEEEKEQELLEFGWEKLDRAVNQVYSVIEKSLEKELKPFKPDILIWFVKMSCDSANDEFSLYTRTLANLVYMDFNELRSKSRWNPEEVFGDIYHRVITIDYKDMDFNEEWLETITSEAREFYDDSKKSEREPERDRDRGRERDRERPLSARNPNLARASKDN